MEYAAGIDFGGTSAKIGLIGRDGAVLAKETVPIDSRADFDGVMRPVAERLNALVSRRPGTDTADCRRDRDAGLHREAGGDRCRRR